MARRPLTAPKRTTKPAARKPAASKATATRRKKKPTRPARKRGPLGLIAMPFVWLFRLFFRLAWRSAVVVLLILGLAVGYVYTTLPDAQALLDGRARGSVTLLDRYGEGRASCT